MGKCSCSHVRGEMSYGPCLCAGEALLGHSRAVSENLERTEWVGSIGAAVAWQEGLVVVGVKGYVSEHGG